ncbi:DUF2254 family protein [Parafrankia sp. FMc2]|uniref:DUF2254 family protein n=1 Tax=Parafrankia sp. FMc2 TaxID=3233196 RepID=UPI0034D5B2B1
MTDSPAPEYEWCRPPRQRYRGLGHRWRTRVVAGAIIAGGTVLGWAVPHWEPRLPRIGLEYQASTAQATLAAIAGAMITLSGFIVTAITVVVQTVQGMSPRLVGALRQWAVTRPRSRCSSARPSTLSPRSARSTPNASPARRSPSLWRSSSSTRSPCPTCSVPSGRP